MTDAQPSPLMIAPWIIAGIMTDGVDLWLNGETVYKVLPTIAPYMMLRALLGISIVAAAFLGLYNLVMTIRHGKPIEAADPAEARAP